MRPNTNAWLKNSSYNNSSIDYFVLSASNREYLIKF